MLRALTTIALLLAEVAGLFSVGEALAGAPQCDSQHIVADAGHSPPAPLEHDRLTPESRPPASQGADVRLLEAIASGYCSEARSLRQWLLADTAPDCRAASPAADVPPVAPAAVSAAGAVRNPPLRL